MSQTPVEHDHDGEEPGGSFVEDDAAETEDELADIMSKQSFPTSDPPSTWAGSDDPPD